MIYRFNRTAGAAILGLALMGTAAPALAASDPTAGKSGTRAGDAKAGDARATRYCVDGTATGSRLSRRTCRTQAEWAARGVDILKELQRNEGR